MNNDRINSYRLVEHLGRGGFGSVYRASQAMAGGNSRQTVVKLLHPNLSLPSATQSWEQFSNSFSKELLAVHLSHKNLITYFESGVRAPADEPSELMSKVACCFGRLDFERHPYSECVIHDLQIPFAWVAMQYAEMGSLADIARDRFSKGMSYDVDEVLEIAKQILEGVRHLHHNGILHRDLKPHNILFFDEDKTWKVADFGMSGVMGDDGVAGTHAAGGTKGWMAPEQTQSLQVSEKADIYSIGQMLYYLLTKEHGFEKGLEPPPVSESNPHASTRLSEIINRAIAFHPDQRTPSADDLLDELSDSKVYSSQGQVANSYPDVGVRPTPSPPPLQGLLGDISEAPLQRRYASSEPPAYSDTGRQKSARIQRPSWLDRVLCRLVGVLLGVLGLIFLMAGIVQITETHVWQGVLIFVGASGMVGSAALFHFRARLGNSHALADRLAPFCSRLRSPVMIALAGFVVTMIGLAVTPA